MKQKLDIEALKDVSGGTKRHSHDDHGHGKSKHGHGKSKKC